MNDPVDTRRLPRRALLLGGAALAVLALVAALVLGLRGGDESGAAAAPATTSPTTTPSPTAAPSESTSAPTPSESAGTGTAPAAETGEVVADELPPSLPAVSLQDSVDVEGTTVAVASVEAVQAEGNGPGNVNGPALRVTVQLTNQTAADVDLNGVAVALAHGAEQTPASPVDDLSVMPFAGTLAPGATAAGAYVFGVPVDVRDLVTVTVGYRPGASRAVFSGSAA